MTAEEAIKALKHINLTRVHPFYSWEEMAEVRDTAIEALEKQIPKKPIIYTDTRNLLDYNGNDYGVREVDVYDCPNCGFDISDKSVCEEYEYKPSCCPECGQKLNWEDWSEEE